MKKFVCLVAVAALFAIGSVRAEETKSGLKIGSPVGAFNVKDVTGPNKGTSLCYRCQFGARPTITIFTRTMSNDVASVVKSIDKMVGGPRDAGNQNRAFVVVLTEDADTANAALIKSAKDNGIANVPLTIFDGQAGPDGYEISKDAEITVLMWEKGSVKVNRAFGKNQFDADAQKKVLEDAKKFLG